LTIFLEVVYLLLCYAEAFLLFEVDLSLDLLLARNSNFLIAVFLVVTAEILDIPPYLVCIRFFWYCAAG